MKVNKKKPAVTITIAAYNLHEYIGECLDSIASQSFKDFECIVVDDCSQDITCEIVEAYSKQDSRFSLVKHETNKGIGYTRNEMFNLAKGKYTWQIDGDDTIPENALKILYDIAERDQCDIARGNFIYNEFGKIKKHWINLSKTANTTFDEASYMLEFQGGIWLNLFRVDFIKAIKMPCVDKLDAGQDTVLNSYAYTKATKISVTDEPVYIYRRRPNSTMTTELKDRKNVEEARAHRRVFQNLETHPYAQMHFSMYLCMYRYNLLKRLCDNLEFTMVKPVIDEFKNVYQKWEPSISYDIIKIYGNPINWDKERHPHLMEFAFKMHYQDTKQIFNWIKDR